MTGVVSPIRVRSPGKVGVRESVTSTQVESKTLSGVVRDGGRSGNTTNIDVRSKTSRDDVILLESYINMIFFNK